MNVNRLALGWLLLAGSPGVAATTLVLLAAGVEAATGRTPLWAAGLLVFCTWAVAAFGAATGAYLLARRADPHPMPVAAAGAAGTAVFLACVFVAEKVLKWI